MALEYLALGDCLFDFFINERRYVYDKRLYSFYFSINKSTTYRSPIFMFDVKKLPNHKD